MSEDRETPAGSRAGPGTPPGAVGTGDGYTVVAVTGEQAHDFLQRILTAEIPAVDAEGTVLAGLCTPKGRLLALARLVPWHDGYRLVLPEDVAEDTVARLRMYVLRSRVEVAPCGPDWQLLQATGPEVPELLAAHGLPPPRTAEARARGADRAVVHLPGAPERYWLLGPAAALAPLREALTQRLPAAGPGYWRRLAIAAGQPQIHAATRELLLPQMVNLDHLGGVSFSKGCFPGQEVVARTHHRGRIKQRMYRAQGAGEPPAPGTEIRSGSGQLAGHLVVAAPDGDGYAALASIQEEYTEAGLAAAGRALQLEGLP